jgi:hypothetical protein
MKQKIEVIKKYLEFFPYSEEAKNNLKLCEYAEELGIKLNGSYYPKIDCGYFVINSQIKAGKKYRLTNSKTNFEQNGIDTIILWTESCGRLAFINEKYWHDVQEEWDWFCGKLLSYKPLDYDEMNNNYIYDVKNGKKLINDYKSIIEEFNEKLKEKIVKTEIEEKKKQIEKLQKELNTVN